MENFFNLLKIRTRLLIFAVLMTGASAIISAISIIELRSLNNDLQTTSDILLPAVSNIQMVETNLTEVKGLIVEASLTTNTERMKEIQEEINQLAEKSDAYISIVRPHLTSDKALELYENFTTSLTEYRQLREAAFEQTLEGEDSSEAFSQVIEISEIVSQRIYDLVDFIYSTSSALNESSIEKVERGVIILVAASSIVTVIAIIISIFIIQSLTRPIARLRTELNKVEKGDLTVNVPTNYKHEFGEMFVSFQNMSRNLGSLINNVKGTSANVSRASDNVVDRLTLVNQNVEKIDSAVQNLANDINNQVASLKESSVAMDGIAGGIQQIAESSTSVAELAMETSLQANGGNAVIEKSVMQMETINQVVEATSGVVDRLVKRTKTINEALKAITTIAEQTNLLALNASIEAARAGEQGRGFAVVADEVSKLAAQSKESANEINGLLQEITEDTKEAIHSMEHGKSESKQGIEIIRQAGGTFTSIVKQVNAMTEQVQEISATIEEMSAGTEEVNASLSKVAHNSEEISRQAMTVVQYNNEEVEMLDSMLKATSDTKSGVEKLEEELNEFKTE